MGVTCISKKESAEHVKPISHSNAEIPSENSNAHSNSNLPGTATIALGRMKDKSPNSKNYIKNLKNETIIKKINEVGDDQLIIENCVNCTIIVLDYSFQVTIDKCKDCIIFIGPCKSKYYNS